MRQKFTWPAYPKSNSEFELLMQAVDAALDTDGLLPSQRPIHVARLFWEALDWEGNVLPPRELSSEPGFLGEILMAKAHHWYSQMYGEQLKGNFHIGQAPYRLGNSIWRVHVALIFGEVTFFADRNITNKGVLIGSRGNPASFNVLGAIENLPEGLAQRIPEDALRQYAEFYVSLFHVFGWRNDLPNTELFQMARADYDASTSELMAHRYGQSRWAAQQAVEKTIKGILAISGTDFPRSAKGHDLVHLGELLAQNHQILLDSTPLKLAACSPGVRYGEDPSTECDAYEANHAALRVFEKLRVDVKTNRLLGIQRVGE